MNIVHILEDYSHKSGGIRTVVKDLHKRLITKGINSIIVTTEIEPDDDAIIVAGHNKPWRYSHNLSKTLKALHSKKKLDVIHIHGVWMYPQYRAAKFAIKEKIPFLLTPHGMYEPWLWSKGTLKKKLYFNFVVKSFFSKANYLHVITNNEAKEVEALFPKTPTIEIPNLIDVNQSTGRLYNEEEKYILYLGRLDQKKGIDLLIESFANLNLKNIKLKIAGGFNDYKIELEKLVRSLNLEQQVEFLGLITGKEKISMFSNAFVFVAPSHSEVVGMVNLEAAILKTPVITTFQTGLKEEWSNNGGILINPNVKEIESALKKALSWSNETRNFNGEMLQKFVMQEYSWEFRFKDWTDLYSNMSK